MNLKINWLFSTIFIIPLIFIIYYISKLNMLENNALGIIGILIFFSFNQFFFQRRNLIFTIKTLLGFYIFGIFSSLFISYTYFYTKSDLFGFLVLFQLYFFFVILNKTSIPTKIAQVDSLKIKEEEKYKKWYQKIIASKTQQKKNKEFIYDFLIFIVFIISLFLIKNTII